MKFHETSIQGAYLVSPDLIQDSRGFFARQWCSQDAIQRGIPTEWLQISISHNVLKGTFRGMHFQKAPFEEVKYVQCISGKIWDVMVDLRPDSPSYLRSFGTELSQVNRHAVFIPKGVAHGFLTLEDASTVMYWMAASYQSQYASGVKWDDPAFSLSWPFSPLVISDQDSQWPAWTVK